MALELRDELRVRHRGHRLEELHGVRVAPQELLAVAVRHAERQQRVALAQHAAAPG